MIPTTLSFAVLQLRMSDCADDVFNLVVLYHQQVILVNSDNADPKYLRVAWYWYRVLVNFRSSHVC